MTDFYDDMSEAAVLNYLAGTTDFGDASAIRRIAAYIDAATGSGSPEGAVTGAVGDLYTDSTNGHLYIKGSGTGNTGWVQLESATSGSGDVNGPGSSTDNALVRFDGTGGKTVQNSGITVNDSGELTTNLTVNKASPRIIASGTGVAYLQASSTDNNALIYLDSPAGAAYSGFQLRSTASVRWYFRRDFAAEAGSNAGSDFELVGYADDGSTALGTWLKIKRSTGKTTLGSVGATAGLELGSSGPRVMSGTGSPEGVVTAPVGSTWTDTATTTGAIQWIKATGTGNTGWVVQYGDTGARNIKASLENSWSTYGGTDPVYVRRIGSHVQIESSGIVGTSASSTTFYTLPVGFRPTGALANFFANYTGAGPVSNGLTITSGGACILGGTSANYTSGRFFASWMTSDAWPSSLPGT